MKKKQFRSFEEARNFIHSLGLKSQEECKEYYKSGKNQMMDRLRLGPFTKNSGKKKSPSTVNICTT